MTDLSSRTWIVVKGMMFAAIALITAALILLEKPSVTRAALLALLVWASCRFYYFLFYVLGAVRGPDPALRGRGRPAGDPAAPTARLTVAVPAPWRGRPWSPAADRRVTLVRERTRRRHAEDETTRAGSHADEWPAGAMHPATDVSRVPSRLYSFA